jgi:hypothetical protein
MISDIWSLLTLKAESKSELVMEINGLRQGYAEAYHGSGEKMALKQPLSVVDRQLS